MTTTAFPGHSRTPITFSCTATLHQTPEEIAAGILDLDRWPEFEGYGPLPGIQQAAFEVRTDEIVGTRIRVKNRDGSTHVEEIMEWEPSRRLRLRMGDFAPPVSRLATAFDETWEFQRTANGTHVTRSLALHPSSQLTKPLLWLISRLLKRAIARHLNQLNN